MFICAVDLDGMLLAFPDFFAAYFAAMQGNGHKVGILTARPMDEMEENLAALAEYGITPDFFVGKPEDMEMTNGEFKARACTELGVTLLFDDFQASDPDMLAEFFAHNTTTVPFTSWAYQP